MPDIQPTLSVYPAPAPGVVGRQVQNEAVVVLARESKVKVLNEVGARIWSLADGSRTIADIAAVLCTEYQVDPAQAQVDVLQFVSDLLERGALVLLEHPSGTQV